MEIKIISSDGQLYGVQRTSLGQFHNFNERYLYLGQAEEGEVILARLVYQAKYPGDQWVEMLDWVAQHTDRVTRRVYLDSHE